MRTPGVSTKKRMVASLIAILVILGGIIIRLGYIQLVQGGDLQAKALDQWTSDLPVTAKRGSILDRNGQSLAQSASTDTVLLRPNQIKDENAEETARVLSDLLEMDYDSVLEKVKDKSKGEIWLKRQVEREVVQEIKSHNLKGVAFSVDSKRYYPMNNLLCQVLGFVSVDGNGLSGIESKLNKYLAGTDGRIVSEVGADRQELPGGTEQYVEPIDGYDVVLSIDYVIQSFAEKYLEEALQATGGKKAMAIVMDPNTGEVLAMANKPDYNLNDPPRNDSELLQSLSRNACVSDVYEPGSTFKIVTTAAGLETGVITKDSTFYCPGYQIVDGQKIKCWRHYNPHGSETLTQGVMNSCNPVFMEIAGRLGKEKFYQYIDAFGFGKKTGIQFDGEEPGILMGIQYVKNVDLARIGFGQTIAVTPIQLTTAVSAAVNGGTLYEPTLVREVRDQDGNTVESFVKSSKGQVISAANSQLLREMLEMTVKEGTGRNAYLPGYRVGGKTGTAQKYEDGKIVSDKTIASFVGFAPADDPKIVVLVVVDEPTIGDDHGSQAAAPYAKGIIQDTLQYMKVQPQYEDGEKELETVEVPDCIDLDLASAAERLQAKGLSYTQDGVGGTVVDMLPKPGSVMEEGSIVLLYMSEKDDDTKLDEPVGSGEEVEVPNLTGKSIADCEKELAGRGLTLDASGDGVAVSQEPNAGESVPVGSKIKVNFGTGQ